MDPSQEANWQHRDCAINLFTHQPVHKPPIKTIPRFIEDTIDHITDQSVKSPTSHNFGLHTTCAHGLSRYAVTKQRLQLTHK